jgi:polysaccharide deacetylase family protein (PEP-CTERM system associated)
MSCDVEDYFQVSAFEDLVGRDRWSQVECRIARNVDKILLVLEESGDKATFFTLGWVARNLPEVVRRIACAGHEVASHGMEHRRIRDQEPKEFQQDAAYARKLLEDTVGLPVVGYRAASWSLDGRTPWAHEMLAEAGYHYSSSIYPVSHDHFGFPDAPVAPFVVKSCGLLEIPASAVRILGRNVPAAGGGYFRLFPTAFTHFLIRRVIAENRPYIFYFHPWELDPYQPRIAAAPLKARFRHYLNLHKFETRWRLLLPIYQWSRMDDLFLKNSKSEAES